MRIDKFIKMTHIIKRRTIANEVAGAGRIKVNGKIVKPSYMVKIGDKVEIQFGDKVSQFEILQIPTRQGQPLEEMVKIL